tara:strand:- start:60 stop:878 length:819 start_codon:yes stop_codon:yes gene_type:complete
MRPTRPFKISFVILLFSLTVTSCSYQFEEPPFNDSQLVDITETKFGEELLSVLKDIPDTDQTTDIKEGLDDDSLVLEVSEDFLVQQQFDKEKNAWNLTVITKNNHHMMFCSLMQEEDDGGMAIKFPENVESKKDEEGEIWLWGNEVAVAEFALELSLSSPKLCVAIPYQDASKIATEGPVGKIVEVIKEIVIEKEVPVEVIVEKEVVKEILVEVPVEVIVEKEVIKEVPVEASGSCNNRDSVSAFTGATNSLMLFGPLLLIAGYRGYRKRNK